MKHKQALLPVCAFCFYSFVTKINARALAKTIVNTLNYQHMKTPITYYGGKQNMLKHILPLIPEHELYCEPFFGGGAVFFAKPQSNTEVINDLNTEVINFYKTIQTRFDELELKIKATLHSRKSHHHATVIYDNPDMFNEVDRAWAFWCLATQSFSSNLVAGWGYEKLSNKVVKKIANKKEAFTDELKQRLNNVQIECNNALQVIKSRDFDKAFHYIDPPYYNSNMGHYKGYSEEDFRALLNVCSTMKGKFLMSSYQSELLQQYVKDNGWYQIAVEKRLLVSKRAVAKTKVEILTSNYPIA